MYMELGSMVSFLHFCFQEMFEIFHLQSNADLKARLH